MTHGSVMVLEKDSQASRGELVHLQRNTVLIVALLDCGRPQDDISLAMGTNSRSGKEFQTWRGADRSALHKQRTTPTTAIIKSGGGEKGGFFSQLSYLSDRKPSQ